MQTLGPALALCFAVIIPASQADPGPPSEYVKPLRFEGYLSEGTSDQIQIPERSGRQPLFAAADEFTRILIRQLQKNTTVQGQGFRGMESDDIYTRSFTRSVPADILPPDALTETAKRALNEWLGFHVYPNRSIGGSGPRFSVSIGDDTSRAFIDVLAYRDGERTNIEFQIRAVRLKAG